MEDRTRVLVVEDHPLIAMDLEDVLSTSGFTVVGPYGNVSDTMKYLERETPDVALLDVDLDGEVSFGIALELRRRGVPFAFATGTSDTTSFPIELSGSAILEKPWQPSSALAFIAECLVSTPSASGGDEKFFIY